MSEANGPSEPTEAAAPEGAAPELRCDFCGRTVPQVRRVALDRNYERLQTPHKVQYACPDCSEAKERRRLGGRG